MRLSVRDCQELAHRSATSYMHRGGEGEGICKTERRPQVACSSPGLTQLVVEGTQSKDLQITSCMILRFPLHLNRSDFNFRRDGANIIER